MIGRARRWNWAVASLGAASFVVACSSGDASRVAVPDVFDLARDPAAQIDQVDPSRSDVLAAADLRGVLDDALIWHGITLIQVMRGAQAGRDDVTTWIDALTANSDAITRAVGLVYGPVGGRAFYQQWAQHTQFLTDYATAVGAGDAKAATAATASLRTYARDSGTFFATATSGGLPATVVQELLDTHVDHMLAMIDAEAHGDDQASRAKALDDNGYLSAIALALAGGISTQFPTVFTGPIETQETAFCSLARRQAGALVLARLFTTSSTDPVLAASAAALAGTIGTDPEVLLRSTTGLLGDADAALASARTLLDRAGTVSSPAGSTPAVSLVAPDSTGGG